MNPNPSSVAREAARPVPWHGVVPVLLPTLVAAASLASLLLLVQIGGVTATGYDLRQLEEARADWERNNYLLETYIADLQSLDRVEHLAKDRLRMVPAGDRVFVTVAVAPQAAPRSAERPPSHVKRPVVPRRVESTVDRPLGASDQAPAANAGPDSNGGGR